MTITGNIYILAKLEKYKETDARRLDINGFRACERKKAEFTERHVNGVRNGIIMRHTIYAEGEFDQKIEVFTQTGLNGQIYGPQRAKTTVNDLPERAKNLKIY